MSDYPKLLWTKDGIELTVQSAEEEAEKRAAGCYGHGESAAADPPAGDDETDDEPTFGASGDDAYVKRPSKKKK